MVKSKIFVCNTSHVVGYYFVRPIASNQRIYAQVFISMGKKVNIGIAIDCFLLR